MHQRGTKRSISKHPELSRKLSMVAILFAFILSACSSESFKPTGPYPMPTPPPAPAQAPAAPSNPARFLDGTWLATYPGGPLRVIINLDEMLRGRNYVATLVDGSKDIPAGQVVWRGTPDPNVPGLVTATQICAAKGFVSARWVDVRLLVADRDHFREELVNPKDCPGFPVKFTRAGPAPRLSND